MRKAQAVVTFKDTTILNYSILYKGANIGLKSTTTRGDILNNTYATFNDLYNSVLLLAKMNDFKIDYYESFGCKWYNIYFIDIDKPYEVQKYGLKP